MPRTGLRLLPILLVTLAAAPVWAHGSRSPELRVAPFVEPADVAPWFREVARLPDSAGRLERSLRSAPRARSRVGLAELTGAFIVAGGLAGLGWFSRRDRRMAVATATAALVLGFVVESTPHLVHHVLDRDKGAGCQILQTVERSQMALEAVDVAPAPTPAQRVDTPPSVALTTLAVPAPCGRAPPA